MSHHPRASGSDSGDPRARDVKMLPGMPLEREKRIAAGAGHPISCISNLAQKSGNVSDEQRLRLPPQRMAVTTRYKRTRIWTHYTWTFYLDTLYLTAGGQLAQHQPSVRIVPPQRMAVLEDGNHAVHVRLHKLGQDHLWKHRPPDRSPQ